MEKMSIVLDETELNLLLEQKKKHIGRKVTWDSVLTVVSFLVSTFTASYDELFGIPGGVLKAVFVCIGIFFFGKLLYDVFDKKNSYSHTDLIADINKLNKVSHKHSLVAIKDTFNEFPNRFLVYYEHSWDCYLLPNFKNNVDNVGFISDGISNRLNVRKENITISYVDYELHKKYSVEHKENRYYAHTLFSCNISEFPEPLKKDSFEIAGIKYKWLTIAEMEQDENIREKNSEVVAFVKRCCS